MDNSIYFALASNFIFTLSSLGYRRVSRRASPLWMNVVKTLVTGAAFAVAATLALGTETFSRPGATWVALMLSGFVGLAIGDTFLLKSMAVIGAARTLLLFSFHPIWTGLFAFFLFGQRLAWNQFAAVAALIGCVWSLLRERDAEGQRAWPLAALCVGLLAVTLDASGVLLTRWAFDSAPALDIFEANAIRCAGALVGFAAVARLASVTRWDPIDLLGGWRRLTPRDRTLAVVVSLTGGFVSLTLWLTALRSGTLAVLSAIAGVGPLFATLLESIVDRRWPSRALWMALGFFALGFALLNVSA